ncbi:MAG: 1-acyl-sn-glycerol-3-phosphate acyltransferase [Candidatus Omnitrophica bacterium]|nr:1-acyl-sn-glycerol-3-phosphate acyltransferase [Candidatus Omnitrophota bacterium]
MWYWFFKILFTPIFKIFFRLKVEGLENLPKKTNFIIVANHRSYLDALVVMVAIPKKINVIAMRLLYKIWWLRWFLNINGALPCGSASQKAAELLMKNKNVGLFPEGGISPDGKLMEFRRGAALLAIKTGRPIVPCAILGTFEAFPLGAKFPRFTPLKVKIAKPVYMLKEIDDVIEDIYLQEGMLRVRNIIKEMLNAG